MRPWDGFVKGQGWGRVVALNPAEAMWYNQP